jgi:PKD repeat protein
VSVSIGPVAAFTDSIGAAYKPPSWIRVSVHPRSIGCSGDGSTSSASAFTHTYPGSGPFNVMLIATAADGCSDDTTMTLLLPPPVVAGAAWLSDPCDALQSFADSSQNATSLLWDLGDGSTSTATALVHAYPGAGSYTITLVADPGSPCADTTVFTITVGNIPSPRSLTPWVVR